MHGSSTPFFLFFFILPLFVSRLLPFLPLLSISLSPLAPFLSSHHFSPLSYHPIHRWFSSLFSVIPFVALSPSPHPPSPLSPTLSFLFSPLVIAHTPAGFSSRALFSNGSHLMALGQFTPSSPRANSTKCECSVHDT